MIRLVKQCKFPTSMLINDQRHTIDAAWIGTGGYTVVRLAGRRDPVLWVRELDGRWASHHTLTECAEDIAWLRARNR